MKKTLFFVRFYKFSRRWSRKVNMMWVCFGFARSQANKITAFVNSCMLWWAGLIFIVLGLEKNKAWRFTGWSSRSWNVNLFLCFNISKCLTFWYVEIEGDLEWKKHFYLGFGECILGKRCQKHHSYKHNGFWKGWESELLNQTLLLSNTWLKYDKVKCKK